MSPASRPVFAIDVGSGTQDILLTDENLTFYAKLVLPAPTQLYAGRVRKSRTDIFCDGYTMGGGAISGALTRHAQQYHVVMTPEAARTVRDDLEQVEARGIRIGTEADMKDPFLHLTLKDVDMARFQHAFREMDYPFPGDPAVAVAVQDHGVAPRGKSDRQFRFEQFAKKIRRGATLKDFIFTKATPRYSRVSAVIRSLKDEGYEEVLVMDTKMAGIFGGLEGVTLPAVAVDVGNGHTTVASVNADGTIAGIFETHTADLTPKKLELYIKKLADGSLTNGEIFDAGGHGACVREAITPEAYIATGPRRGMALKMKKNVSPASPFDDVYMAGPVGMARAYREMRD